MTAAFIIDGKPHGSATLTLVGLDSEDSKKTPMRLTLNDAVLYQGADPLPNDADSGPGGSGSWAEATWRVPSQVLQDGLNTFSITNLDPSDKVDFPIFIMIDSATFRW